MNKKDNFENTEKYKLYRNVHDIIHPSISKKNVSNYKIIIEEDLLDLLVFYPEKVSSIKSIILFIPGDGNITDCRSNYASICKNIATKTNSLIIGIDYETKTQSYKRRIKRIKDTISYILEGLREDRISKDRIFIMADSTGATMLAEISKNKKDYPKEIYCYPILKKSYEKDIHNIIFQKKIKSYFTENKIEKTILDEEIKSFPKCTIICGGVDIVKNDCIKFYEKLSSINNEVEYHEIDFASHGFMGTKDHEIQEEFIKLINDYIKIA